MFDPAKLYRTDDPALRVLASAGVMAQWRHFNQGPAYIKTGRRILYKGSDLNAWLDAQRIEPRDTGPAARGRAPAAHAEAATGATA